MCFWELENFNYKGSPINFSNIYFQAFLFWILMNCCEYISTFKSLLSLVVKILLQVSGDFNFLFCSDITTSETGGESQPIINHSNHSESYQAYTPHYHNRKHQDWVWTFGLKSTIFVIIDIIHFQLNWRRPKVFNDYHFCLK